jgi:hypothetical protein
MNFRAISLWLMFSILCFPASGTAGDPAHQETRTQGTQTKSDSPAPKEKTAPEPKRGDVQSRGLFKKNKKKQVGGSAGHSQPAGPPDEPAR